MNPRSGGLELAFRHQRSDDRSRCRMLWRSWEVNAVAASQPQGPGLSGHVADDVSGHEGRMRKDTVTVKLRRSFGYMELSGGLCLAHFLQDADFDLVRPWRNHCLR